MTLKKHVVKNEAEAGSRAARLELCRGSGSGRAARFKTIDIATSHIVDEDDRLRDERWIAPYK